MIWDFIKFWQNILTWYGFVKIFFNRIIEQNDYMSVFQIDIIFFIILNICINITLRNRLVKHKLKLTFLPNLLFYFILYVWLNIFFSCMPECNFDKHCFFRHIFLLILFDVLIDLVFLLIYFSLPRRIKISLENYKIC